MSEGLYDVSVIILTYNADWKKLSSTLDSVICQKNVKIEILVADDGSVTRWDDKLHQYFDDHNFDDFKLVNSQKNEGTVRNYDHAVEFCRGKYIKPISPGDYLYSETTLAGWFHFMQKCNAAVSFGDAIYYYLEDEQVNIAEVASHPMNMSLYDEKCKRKKFFVNYMLANDTILGASLMLEANFLRQYLKRIVGKVVYAEDYMLRLAVFENIQIMHYPDNVLWYEYGIGISTTSSERWKNMLKRDFDATDSIIAETMSPCDAISARYLLYLRQKPGILRKFAKILLFPYFLVYREHNKKHPDKTSVQAETAFLADFLKGEKYAGN